MPQRSAATMLSMSPPRVREQQHAEHRAHALNRHGDADHELALVVNADNRHRRPGQRGGDFGICLAVGAADLGIEGQIVLPHARLDRLPERGERVRLFGVGRRQVVAQHLASRIERVGIEDQRAVAVIDAGPASRRLHQRAQDRGGALGIDGKFERAAKRVVVALALLALEQLLGIELHLVGVDAGRSGDGAGDDLALGEQALDLGVDQPCAELVQIENARNEDREPDQVQHDDAPCQAGEAVPEGEVQRDPAIGSPDARQHHPDGAA